MIINKKLSPNMAMQLTNTVEDWQQIEKSNLSEWFKGTYAICMLWFKPELYSKCRPDVNIEQARQEIINISNKRKEINAREESGRFSR